MVTSDTIEREIFIQAGIDHVWSLVSKAGFWVGEELHFDSVAAPGETVVIDTDKYGSYPVQVDRLEAPRYAAYRWASGYPGAEPTAANSTLVEFTLVEQADGVLLRLKESGFAALADGPTNRDNNVAGWSGQLEQLRRIAGGVTVG